MRLQLSSSESTPTVRGVCVPFNDRYSEPPLADLFSAATSKLHQVQPGDLVNFVDEPAVELLIKIDELPWVGKRTPAGDDHEGSLRGFLNVVAFLHHSL